jgi:hypothetical protein
LMHLACTTPGGAFPNQMLGLIPAVLDSDISNFSKADIMEGAVFVMLRLTKMVQRPNRWGAAMMERTRRGQTRSGKTMETTEKYKQDR